jgi:hypothetical protein
MVHSEAIYVSVGFRPRSPASHPFALSSRLGSHSTQVRIRGPLPPGGRAITMGFPQIGQSCF